MLNALIALAMFLSVFIPSLISVSYGRRYGLQQMARHPENKLEVVGVAEAAVFALLGLLIAFTFAGAYDRFEGRKVQVIEEANAIETAYMRIDLLAPTTQADLRTSFHQYVDDRLNIFKSLPDFEAALTIWHHTQGLEDQIWKQIIAACKTTADGSTSQLVVESVNTMFDLANMRVASTRIHSPLIVIVLLIAIAVISAFLAGISTAKNKNTKSVYILLYVFITSFTMYIILDLEFPRIGLIRVDAFDHVLESTAKRMN